MEVREEQAPGSPKPKDAPLCEECKAKPSKYKCPGCSIRSCSLPCVKAHKQRTACTGKKSLTKIVPISQFDDALLRSDYNFLEEAKRVTESAQKLRTQLRVYNYFKLPNPLKSLRNAAASRRTRLLFLPPGMTKRQINRSRYDQRKKSIFWTIELRFHSTDVAVHEHGVNENMNLLSVVGNHIKPGPWNNELRKFSEEQLDHLKCFICINSKGHKSHFRQLHLKVPIREQLASLDILEYPVVHVFLPSHNTDFKVVQEVDTVHRPDARGFESNHSPEGIPFKEEVVEDASLLDPQVLEFEKHANSRKRGRNPFQNRGPRKAVNCMSGRRGVGTDMPSKSPYRKCESMERGKAENMEFDFDQSLIDSYSDLIAQINPDDFLDLGNECLEGVDIEGMGDLPELPGVFPGKEELEEGEIVE